jgi:uncharacterized protein YxjI
MAAFNYLIRRRVFVLFGAKFDIYDAAGRLIGFSKQKAFKLREDIRVFQNVDAVSPFLQIHARDIIDFSTAYDVLNEAGERIGTWKRKGWRSLVRDTWIVEDGNGNEVAMLQEDSMLMALVRRFLTNLIPQNFNLIAPNGQVYARYEQCFNPFIFKLRTTIYTDSPIPPMLVLGGAICSLRLKGVSRVDE